MSIHTTGHEHRTTPATTLAPAIRRSLSAAATHEVVTVPAATLARRPHVVPAAFNLRFPARWCPPAAENVHADAIERETLTWLRSYGIGIDADEAEKLRKFDCRRYGGCSLPVADFTQALLVTQFISLWLFWDDMQVEEEEGWDIEEVVRALTCPDALASSSRYVAAWADLGRRLRATQSRSWQGNLAVTMRQWLANAKVETAIARRFKAGECPTFAALFECRTISIGMYPTFHLIEYSEGIELPVDFHQHPAVARLKRLASRLVGMGNDLGGIAKDLRHRWLNLAVVLSEQAGISIARAFGRVVDIHNADVQEFDRVAATLPSWGPQQDHDISRWVRAVRYNVHGFTLWEATAERYQEYKALVGDIALVTPLVYQHHEPALCA